jgi:hypothetical protein
LCKRKNAENQNGSQIDSENGSQIDNKKVFKKYLVRVYWKEMKDLATMSTRKIQQNSKYAYYA